MRYNDNCTLQEESQRKTWTPTTRMKLHWQQKIPRKEGRSPLAETSLRRRILIRIMYATTSLKRGISRPRAGKVP